tara:strand:- start:8445 stop:8825 length:381 start_codon:yes stop_codon:yes gene_type:complete
MINFVLILIKFSFSGAFGVAINFLITFILKEKLSYNKYLSNSLAITIALSINFFCNKYWTYSKFNTVIYPELLRFVFVIIISIIMNHLIVYYLTKTKKIKFYYSKMIAVFLVFIWNFCMHTFFTFN